MSAIHWENTLRRLKVMPKAEFQEVLSRRWRAVILADNAVPSFAQGIPARCFIASGQDIATRSYSSATIQGGWLVGGIDVYRDAPDDPVALNKDWYAVVAPTRDASTFLVDGPVKDDEHWLDEIPERYSRVEIIGSPDCGTE